MALQTQDIVVSFEQQGNTARTIVFTPKLTGADGEILLSEYRFKVVTSPATVAVPVPSVGSFDYEVKFVASAGMQRDLVADVVIAKTAGAQFLSELIVAGTPPSDSAKTYIDTRIGAQDLAIAAQDLAISSAITTQNTSIAAQFAAINGALNLDTATFTGDVKTKTVFSIVNTSGIIQSQWRTKGASNQFIGYAVGNLTLTGSNHTLFGSNVGTNLTTAENSTFIGANAGAANSSGTWNTFVGAFAGFSNTTGQRNAFFGHSAGRSNTTGIWNTFIGDNAGYYHVTGDSNTFVGMDAGQSSTGGDLNTGVGVKSARSHQTGSNGNSSFGAYAGILCSTGGGNLFLGYASGQRVVTGSRNTLVGTETAWGVNGLATGDDNIFLGWRAGAFNTGSRNILIGNEATTADLAQNDRLNIAGVITADLATSRVDIPGTLYVDGVQITGSGGAAIAPGSGGDSSNVPVFGDGSGFADSVLTVSPLGGDFADTTIYGTASRVQFGAVDESNDGALFLLNVGQGKVHITAPNGFYVNGVLVG